MRYIYISIIAFLMSGCAITEVKYESETSQSLNPKENLHYKECRYLAGPFLIGDELTIESALKNALKYANNQGLSGTKITNTTIKEGGWSAILVSELCLYIDGTVE